MNQNTELGVFIKKQRKDLGLTQKEFALRSGLGLRFVRELERGKPTVRLDKVQEALHFLGCHLEPTRDKTDE
jgi:y4mF family transcriptional regulator